jgi:hypothetical protein
MAGRRLSGNNLPRIPSQWQALKLPNGRTIRITPDKRASVLDAIEAATGARNPRSIWDRIKKEFPILLTKVDEWQFPGAGQRLTPVTNRDGFVEILALLPGGPGDRTRHELVDKYTRYLDGDVSMIEEMIDRQENVEDLERVEARAKARLSQKALGSAIQACGGANTRRANTYATVNDRNNLAVLGARAKAIQAAGGNRSTRDNTLVDKVRLSLIHTTEMLEAHSLGNGEARGHGAIVRTCDTVASDVEALRRKHGIPDVLASHDAIRM